MDQQQRQTAKLSLVGGMQRGLPWQEAAEAAGAELSRATAFRALRVVRAQGEEALVDGRHGHPHKLTEPVRGWMVEYCRGAPKTPSRVVQAEIEQRFHTTVSVSQINRVRAVLGVSSRSRDLGEKSGIRGG
jgi:transposase